MKIKKLFSVSHYIISSYLIFDILKEVLRFLIMLEAASIFPHQLFYNSPALSLAEIFLGKLSRILLKYRV
jgi:hypothetical protein